MSQQVDENRWEIALESAYQWGVFILLKGPFSVIASPSGELRIIPFANPVLATAGTGDVLAGIIGAMLARNLSPFDAATIGAAIHGIAGELLELALGNQGALATDLLTHLPLAIRSMNTVWPVREFQETGFLHADAELIDPKTCVH